MTSARPASTDAIMERLEGLAARVAALEDENRSLRAALAGGGRAASPIEPGGPGEALLSRRGLLRRSGAMGRASA